MNPLIDMNMIPRRQVHNEIREAKKPRNDILETISILADAMMSHSYDTVEQMTLTNLLFLMPHMEEIFFPSQINEEVLEKSKNLFAKRYIYNKILKRQVDSTEMLHASRLGFDDPHIFYILSAIIPLSSSYPYIIPRNSNFIHDNCNVSISTIFPFIYGTSFSRAIFHIEIRDANYHLLNDFLSEEDPRGYHSFRSLISEIEENTKDTYLTFIYEREIMLFENDFTGIYKRYRIIGVHSQRFLPLLPKFLESKALFLDLLRLFIYLESHPRLPINYDTFIAP
jgi:hypothetical protein